MSAAAFFLWGGLEALAALILLGGAVIARRRITRLGYALAAGALIALHGLVLAIMSSAGRSWGGDAGGWPMAASAAMFTVGAIAVALFVVRPMHAGSEAVQPQIAQTELQRTAALCVTASTALSLWHRLVYLVDWSHALAGRGLWLYGVGGVVLAIGLWRGRPWAWWVAVVWCVWSTLELLEALVGHPSGFAAAVLRPQVVPAWLRLVALVLLLRPAARGPFARSRSS